MGDNPIKLVNENGAIVGYDPETEEKTPIEFESLQVDEVANRSYVEVQETESSPGSRFEIDLSVSNHWKITMNTDTTFDFVNGDNSGANQIYLKLVQDETGGRTPSFSPTVHWPGGESPAWSSYPGAEDVVTLVEDPDAGKWDGYPNLGLA